MGLLYDIFARTAWSMGITAGLHRAARVARVAGRRYLRPHVQAPESYQVLFYHRVHTHSDPFSVAAVHPRDFEQQLLFLKEHYSVLPLAELWRRAQERSLPPNAVAITFDDGYADNYHLALPLLRKHGLPATLFLATAAADHGEPLWYDKILHAFKTTSRSYLDFPPLGIAAVRLDSVATRRLAAARCLERLRRLPDADRRRCQGDLLSALGVTSFAALAGLMMGWREARLLEEGGFSVEAHTVSHPIMSRLTLDEARAELLGCKRAIEAAIQKEVRFFAYPNGKREDFTAQTQQALRETGFVAAFTTVPTKNIAADDPYALGRATPWYSDVARFALTQARINLGNLGHPQRLKEARRA